MHTASQKASVAVLSFLAVGVMLSQSVVLYVFAQECYEPGGGGCFPPPDPNREDIHKCEPGFEPNFMTRLCDPIYVPPSPPNSSSTTQSGNATSP